MNYTADQTANIHQAHFAFITVEENDHLLRINLNRPKKKNALTPTMVNELAFAFSYAHHNPEVWAIVLGAEGDVFCAGADLTAFMGREPENDSSIPQPDQPVVIGDMFKNVHRPVIARVQGDVYAGGFLLLCGSHYVVAKEGIKLGLPEVRRGLWPMQVSAALLEVMPYRQAVDLCLRGQSISAKEALHLGLLTHLTAQDALDDEINKLVETIFQGSPTAIRHGLQALEEMADLPPGKVHGFLQEMLAKVAMTHDAREGITAFREKREPKWTGR